MSGGWLRFLVPFLFIAELLFKLDLLPHSQAIAKLFAEFFAETEERIKIDMDPLFIDVLAEFGDELVSDIHLELRCRCAVDVNAFRNALPADPDRVVAKVDVKLRNVIVLHPFFLGKKPLFVAKSVFVEGDRAKSIIIASNYQKSNG